MPSAGLAKSLEHRRCSGSCPIFIRHSSHFLKERDTLENSVKKETSIPADRHSGPAGATPAAPGTATAPAPSLPLRPQHAASPRPEGMLAGTLGAEGGRPRRRSEQPRLPKGNGCGVWRVEEACSASRKGKGINHGFHLPLGATPPPESSRKGTLALLG